YGRRQRQMCIRDRVRKHSRFKGWVREYSRFEIEGNYLFSILIKEMSNVYTYTTIKRKFIIKYLFNRGSSS
ncbi:hypothetical protein PNU20_15040, partial [Turicibacter sanguinis]|uniref:hypothetical protein n=1 Tax=Turicibacter sanguinis TaxID=154288 RepID=UPI00232B5B73